MIDAKNCEKCGFELNGEKAYIDALDEIWCHSCADNAAEAAYERHCEDFHDGGSTQFKSLQQQQIEARRLK
jgi:hypothetical protein